MADKIKVALLGGPFARDGVELTKTPPMIIIAGCRYVWITDPDTGEFLGAYAYAGKVE